MAHGKATQIAMTAAVSIVALACSAADVSPLNPGELDRSCFDACVDKGEEPDDCRAICTVPDDKKGSKSTSDAGIALGEDAGLDEKLDPTIEKPCIECWYEDAAACVDQAKACEASLACNQLQWCPSLCGKPDCVDECNEIIPTGVAPLADLVQCAVCDDGPCAQACEDSVMLSYCD